MASGLRTMADAAYAARMHAGTPIRRATLADLDALLALEDATFTSDRISRAQWRRHITNRSASVLVHGTPGAIDAAAVMFYRRNSRSARLYSLAVHARTRGSGLGGAMLAACEADARAHGCTAMRLEVHIGNTAAITLYERRGYTRVMRLPRFYEDGADAWRYAKPVTTATP